MKELSRFENEMDRYCKINSKITRHLEDCRQECSTDAWDTVEKAHNDLEYLTIQIRQLIRAMKPSKDSFGDCDRAINAVVCNCGYGVERTLEGWWKMVFPPLLPKRRTRRNSNIEQNRGMIHILLHEYLKSYYEHNARIGMLTKQVIILKYATAPTDNAKDYDNQEYKAVIDEINQYFLVDDSMKHIDLYECSLPNDRSFLTVFLVPQDKFEDWYRTYRYMTENLLINNK